MAFWQSHTYLNKIVPKTLAYVIVMLAFTSASALCLAGESSPSPASLSEKSIEELLEMPVTSVSKRVQSLSESPAAVYVITKEDIRRTGVTTIAEALRMVPGVQVARVTASKWAIGVRGFCDVFSNKLLVLIDGRSVYSPLYSGVLWDLQDTMLEDIDRIEVIRGPGATLWGANAVNGVVNIVTKPTEETAERLAVLGTAGADKTREEGLRVGGAINKNTGYRIYTKSTAYDGFLDASDNDAGDQWTQTRTGFRVDYDDPDGASSLTVQGDTYNESAGEKYIQGAYAAPFTKVVDDDIESSGSNLLLRWTRSGAKDSRSTMQVYLDNSHRFDPKLFGEKRQTLDFDYQKELHPATPTTIVWGLGYRHSTSDTTNGENVAFTYRKVIDNLYSGFIQQDQTVVPNKNRIILGAKLEHNDLTGYEFQPNARTIWTPTPKLTFWGSISRAVRTPSVVDFYSMYSILAPPDAFGKPRVITITSNPSMASEKLTAYELGHRIQASDHFSLDVASFWNFYNDLRSLEPSSPWTEITVIDGIVSEHRHTPFNVQNNFRGNSRGYEASADWIVNNKLRLKFAVSKMNLWIDRSRSYDIAGSNLENSFPKSQYSILSYWDICDGVELNTALYRVSSSQTPVLAVASENIPGYTRFDFNFCIKDGKGGEWSLGALNAFDSKHFETTSVYGEQPTYVGRNYFLSFRKKL